MSLFKFPINKKSMLFLFLILQSNASFADNSSDYEYDFDLSYNTEETEPTPPKDVTKTNIPGMAESVPKKIVDLIDRLNNQNLHKEINDNTHNRLILHGPPGNGKTTFAKKIAETTGSSFVEVSAASIVGTHVGSGPEYIDKLFTNVLKQTIGEFGKNERVVILIDEIDSLASKNDSTEQYSLSMKQLWLWLDRIENNPKLAVIFATNKFKKLDLAFKNRFNSSEIVEIDNLCSELRREIINFYANKIKNTIEPSFELNPEYVNYLVKSTEGLSIRSIKNLLYEINREKLKQAVACHAIATYKNNNTDPDKTDKSFADRKATEINTWANVINTVVHILSYYNGK
jgi:SpoVK/Ycf46/Vps4 family AAA+-type ATPase